MPATFHSVRIGRTERSARTCSSTPPFAARDRRDRAGAAARRLGLHLVDELVLALGRATTCRRTTTSARGSARVYTSGCTARRARTRTARASGRSTSAQRCVWCGRSRGWESTASSRATGRGRAFICRIPLVRELVSWNCVIRVTKRLPAGRRRGRGVVLAPPAARTRRRPAPPQRPGRRRHRNRPVRAQWCRRELECEAGHVVARGSQVQDRRRRIAPSRRVPPGGAR